jgi:hypothetical protein
MDRDALIEAFVQVYTFREPEKDKEFREALARLLEDLGCAPRPAPKDTNKETYIRAIEI